ncbi:MAG: hypothetical protein AB1649_32145 [Chloroflexota bacterium]
MSDVEMNSVFHILPHLQANGPHPAYQDKLALFGQFVGDWDMQIEFFNKDGSSFLRIPGAWSFSWVLDGRAIQDVFMCADLQDPTKNAEGVRRIGTTLRHYNPKADTWQAVYLGATSGDMFVFTAQPVKDEIWLEGKEGDSALIRWIFSDIRADHFHWRGMTSADNGQTWRMEQEMFGARRA